MRNLFQLQNARRKDAGGRYLITIMSLLNDVIIDLVLSNITIINDQICLQLGKKSNECINECISLTVMIL